MSKVYRAVIYIDDINDMFNSVEDIKIELKNNLEAIKLGKYYLTRNNPGQLLKIIAELENYQQENQKYKEVIDKAIYFVEDHIFQFDGNEDFEFLLEILKGKR